MTLTSSPYLWIAVCILGFAIWFRRKKSKLDEFMSSLPGPKPLPLIGHAHLLIAPTQRQIYNALLRFLNNFSMHKMARLTLPPDDFACIVDPYIMQAILRTPQGQYKDPGIYAFFNIPGSLFAGNGKVWSEKRKTAIPGFHSKIMANLDTFYRQRDDQFLESMRRHADSQEIFDLSKEMVGLSLDLLCDTFMGVSLDVQKKADPNLASITYEFPGTILDRFLLRLECIYSIVRGWGSIEHCFRGMEAVAKEAVTKRMQYRATLKHNGDHKDESLESGKKIYLDIFLDKLETDEEGNMDAVIQGMLEIFEAGIATTTAITSWILMLSGALPEMGEKLHAEIEDFFASYVESMDIKNCAKLEYLDMVVKEALRHFGVPFVFRTLEEDVFIKDFGTIPAGTRMMFPLYTLHHHPSYWERPMEFYPEHFLPENVAKRPKSAFVPFLSGVRNCPGGQYAMQTIKCEVTQILSKVKFKAAKMKSWASLFSEDNLQFGFAQIPADGFFVTIEFKDKIIK